MSQDQAANLLEMKLGPASQRGAFVLARGPNSACKFVVSSPHSRRSAEMGFLTGKIPPWLILLAFLTLGIALIVIPHVWRWTWDYGIIPEVGIALLVAAILGFTIDRWMKAELRTDAFLAAIGHILAPEFRAE